MRVAIVGGGVVGICCAYELRQAGAEVVVLERGRLGFGASRGNTGWVCPSFTYPLPAPGIMREGLAGMLRGGGPLAIRPTVDPMFARWLLGFRRSSSRERWQEGVRALLALNARTLELFDAYAAAGVSFEMHRSGLVLVGTTSDGLASYMSLFRELRALGFAGEISEVGPSEACQLEPSLSRARIVGGVHALVDRYVRPETLTAGLAAWLGERGVAFHEQTEITHTDATAEGVLLETSSGRIEADRAVVCAGASSAALLKLLGIRMPLVGARGYSLTVAGGSARPHHALYLAEAKVGISSYEDSVRVAGVFELGPTREELDRKRLHAMISRVDPYFETWRPSEEQPLLEWAGLRPMTADGLPLIGPAPALPNVHVATGHGMLGVTLAPATAALLTPLVLEGREAPELVPFAPTRRA
ncbi:MAG: NAD(P)/FAD-dependent oxidoreductase [Gaiellaceae bacterium]